MVSCMIILRFGEHLNQVAAGTSGSASGLREHVQVWVPQPNQSDLSGNVTEKGFTSNLIMLRPSAS